jgi:outer membrane lipoprotein-sorting protein
MKSSLILILVLTAGFCLTAWQQRTSSPLSADVVLQKMADKLNAIDQIRYKAYRDTGLSHKNANTSFCQQ